MARRRRSVWSRSGSKSRWTAATIQSRSSRSPMRNIEGSVLEDLDLETLKDAVILTEAQVPPIDAFSLQPETLGVETGSDFEPARVVGDHGPGESPTLAGASHRLECGLAVGVGGVPMGRAAHPIGVELGRAGGEDLGHLGAAEVVLAGRPATRTGARGEPGNRGRERVLSGTSGELVDEWPQPIGRLGEGGPAAVAGGVEDRVPGLEQGDPAVARLLLLGEGEQRFRENAVWRTIGSAEGCGVGTHDQENNLPSLPLFPVPGQGDDPGAAAKAKSVTMAASFRDRERDRVDLLRGRGTVHCPCPCPSRPAPVPGPAPAPAPVPAPAAVSDAVGGASRRRARRCRPRAWTDSDRWTVGRP